MRRSAVRAKAMSKGLGGYRETTLSRVHLGIEMAEEDLAVRGRKAQERILVDIHGANGEGDLPNHRPQCTPSFRVRQ